MKKTIYEYVMITIGLILVAAGVYFFLIPNDLAAGGVTGLAMVINHYFPVLNVGAIMLVLNVILFIIGFIFIGSGFGLKTIYSSLMLSFIISMMEVLFPLEGPITQDIFINLIFGILVGAIGMAIVFNQNASTGGTDIIAKIFNKYMHLDIGKGLLLADLLVTLLAIAAFGATVGMYSLLGVILNGFIVDSAIQGFNVIKKVEIVSSKGKEIKEFIIKELDRSATLYDAKGAYSLQNKEVITTVLGKREVIRLKNYIKGIDSKAFIITYNVHETLGEGFTDLME
jgi:uncharacterized membrane-anchored protein YitT (DUF2179 family)